MAVLPLLAALLTLSAPLQSNAPLPRKGWLGTQLAPVTAEIRQKSGVASGGLYVPGVVPGSTAEAAGVRVGDVLVKVGGVAITAAPQVATAVGAVPVGQSLEIEVVRDGKPLTLRAPVKTRPAEKGENYEVLYDQVVSNGHRIRTLVSRPKAEGKRPVLFLVQGIGYVSQENPITGPSGYSRILKAFSDKGFVTVRVDKPGLGDSEGGPANKVDFDRELDAFRQALVAVKKYPFVDPDKVFIFGHSMGGVHGPILASEIPVRGLAVYGTIARTWMEYMVENSRRQAALAGETPASIDKTARQLFAANHLLFNEGLSATEAKTKYPQYAEGVDRMTPDGETLSGVYMGFWKQAYGKNMAEYWSKVDTNVLSIWGENEFIASEADHPMIAQIVNKNHPGKAEYLKLPATDHGFFKTTSTEDSFKGWRTPGPKEINPNVIDALTNWVDRILAKS